MPPSATETHELNFTASVTFGAAAPGSKAPRIGALAYAGGPVQQPWSDAPIVADLAAMELPESVPLLLDHKNEVESIVGQGKPLIANFQLWLTGTLSTATEAGRTVLQLAKDGIAVKASIGATIDETTRVAPGKAITVNNRRIVAGPRGVIIAKRTRLFEVSLVAVPGDRETAVDISAKKSSQQERSPMPPEIPLVENSTETDIRAQERERLRRIDRACSPGGSGWGLHADRVAELRAAAVDGTVSFETLQTELLAILRASRPTGPAIPSGRRDAPAGQVLEAALCLNAGLGESFVGEQFDEQTMNAAVARPMRSTGIHTIFREVCRAAGVYADGFRDGESVRAAFEADRTLRASGSGFSTVSLPGILGNVANKAMLAAYNAVATGWRNIAAVRSNADFKAHTRYLLTNKGQFQKVGPDGELKSFSLDEKGYDSQLDTFGSIITLNRQMIINDDLGAFTQLPRFIGRQAAIAVDKAVFTLLLSNPSNFFSAGNANYIEGAATPLAIASITDLETKFLKQVDSNNDPVLIVPRVLLTPPELAVYASQLVRSAELRNTGDNKEYVIGNPHSGRFTPVASPWLSTSSIIGNSTTAWYLFAEPGDVAAIGVAFLNGRDQPMIESGDTSFDTLGIQWRGYFDFAVAMEDHRAAAKSKGAA